MWRRAVFSVKFMQFFEKKWYMLWLTGLFISEGFWRVFLTQGYHDSPFNICIFSFAREVWQNNACTLRFWCITCTNSKGECIGQASKLKQKYIILPQLLRTKSIRSHYLIHTWHNKLLVSDKSDSLSSSKMSLHFTKNYIESVPCDAHHTHRVSRTSLVCEMCWFSLLKAEDLRHVKFLNAKACVALKNCIFSLQKNTNVL